MKRIIASIITIVVILSVSMTSFADCTMIDSGIRHVHNGSYYYDQYYVTVAATVYDYNVTLVTVKNGVIYNEKTVLVYAGSSATIYSLPSYYPGNYTYYVTYEIAE